MGSNNLISLEVKNFPHRSFLSHVDSNPFKILDLISVFCTSVCSEHSDVLQHFEPYEGCLFISFKNYLKHINEKSFVLTNKMILSLKSKGIFLCI